MNWFWKQRREAAGEIEAHIGEPIDELVESGVPQPEAVRRAHREFGNQTLLTESSREVWGWIWLDRLGQDLRYAMRMLRHSPGFTFVAVLSLALGIGAGTAIFTLMESAVWKPIPVKNPEQLRLLWWHGRDVAYEGLNFWGPPASWNDAQPTEGGDVRHATFTYPIYRELQRDHTVFDSLFTFREIGGITAVVDGNAEPVNCFLVSGDFYREMGISPVIGRPIGPGNDVRTVEAAVALISYEYWTRRFGRDPSVIGKSITLSQAPVTIIGVNPADFTGIAPGANFEIWAPLSLPATAYPSMRSPLDDPRAFWLPVMGRLKRGVPDAQAQSVLDGVLQRRIGADFPGMNAVQHPHLSIESGARGMDHLAGPYGKPLLVLLSLTGLVLLIACANVANLLLAKSAVRRRELGLRLALGAGQARIVRQLLTEGMLLACLAGVAGVILGYLARNSIPALLATSWRPSPFQAEFDLKVLLISLGVAFLTGVLFSLAPAWQVQSMDVNESLKDRSRGMAGFSRLRGGKLLVVFQVAVSLMLLVGAGLFVKTLTNLKAIPIGFSPDRVLLFGLDPPAWRYAVDRAADLYTRLQERSAAIPGVRSATFSTLPLFSKSTQLLNARVTLTGQKGFAMALRHEVGSRFFETMGIPILHGRAVDDRDRPFTPRTAVVNGEFARYFFGEDNPIGRMFKDHSGTQYEIVGVCADALDAGLRNPVRRTFFRYFPQSPHRSAVTFEVKMTGDTAGVVKQIRQIVRSLDSGLAITGVRTQTEQIDDTLSQEQLLAALAAAFGALALILACIGIYGVTAYAVARRTTEIGIRVALGAEPGRVAWMVLRGTLLLAAAGVVIGVPAALALSRFTRSFLYGLKSNDWLTITLAVLALAAAGFLAAYFPARRAAHVDPTIALRHD